VSPGDQIEAAPRLSDTDRAIIRALQEDGRRSFARIATELGSSERSVRNRVRELRDEGVIQITTVADPHLLGYGLIALLGVRADPGRPLSSVASALADVTGAFYVMSVTGRYNVLVEISCRDLQELLAIVDDEISEVAGVVSVEIHPYLRLHYQDPAFELMQRRGERPGGAVPPQFDDVDRSIIARLNDDGRTPFQHIARQLGVSESQIRQRVKRMTASSALRVIALANPAGLGFRSVALVGVTITAGSDAEAVATELSQHGRVIYVAICTGRFDLFAEIACRDLEAMHELLRAELRSVAGVERLEPWLYLQLHYRRVTPR
jgi:DNA-binding Lrp family transcriptional regulator